MEQLLVFELAGQAYALPMNDVQEVAFMVRLSRPAGLPDILSGFLAMNAIAVPVLSLRQLLELDDDPPGLYTPLIILRHPQHPLALRVDRLCDIGVPPTDWRPVEPQHSINGCLSGQVSMGPRIVTVMDPARLLLRMEEEGVRQLQVREQERLQAFAAEG